MSQNEQKPKDVRNRQRLSFVSGEMCFFLMTCQDLKMAWSLKIQLEPLLLLYCRAADGYFCYIWQSCDPSCQHGVMVHVEDYQEGEIRVQFLQGTGQYGHEYIFNSSHHFSPHFQMESTSQEYKALRNFRLVWLQNFLPAPLAFQIKPGILEIIKAELNPMNLHCT